MTAMTNMATTPSVVRVDALRVLMRGIIAPGCDTGGVSGASTPNDQSPAVESGAPLPTEAEVRARLQTRTAEAAEAAEKRKGFLGLVRGSKLRVGIVQAEADEYGLEALVASLGLTAASLMLAQIVNGNLVVKDAKMAADVAKISLEVHRAMAQTEQADLAELSPEERAKRRKVTESAIKELAKSLVERAQQEQAHVDAPSPATGASLAIVPPSPPVRAQEG